jgi:Polyketide cyclase / dehydrase and lipid transport
MGKARAVIDLPGQVSVAESLWYDVNRWASFVDGFAHVEKADGDWPRVGARVRWRSLPNGRGLVQERVTHYEVRSGQTVEVEDPKLRGTQVVKFTPKPEHSCQLEITLDYRLKDGNPFTPVVDALFVRRMLNDALRRTLARFKRELRGDLELVRER